MKIHKANSRIVVFSAGTPPIGSWHQRIKMFNLGFSQSGYDFEHIVPYYAPTPESKATSPSYVKYCLKERNQNERSLLSILSAFMGTVKGALYLLRMDKVSFIIVPGLNFLQGLFVFIVAKVKKIPYYAEIADESGYIDLDKNNMKLADYIAKYNQILYERIVLKRADKIFVFTSFLENKYLKCFDNRKLIIRTIPSLIDIEAYDKLLNADLSLINQKDIELLSGSYTKIVYAGACNRTNGLFFFLDSLAAITKRYRLKYKVFFFFVYGNVEIVKTYCKKLDILDNIVFFKPVLPQFIPSIYQKADILLLPEHGDIIANAGFPGKTSELMASGKAILSTNFSDLSLYLKDHENAMVSEVGDRITYENNLLKLMTSPKLRSTLGLKARETAAIEFNCLNAIKLYL